MFENGDSFETISKKMDDDFNKTAKKMIIASIIGYILIFGVVCAAAVGLLYLVKVWFFGGF